MSDLTSPLGGDDLAKALRDAYGQGRAHGRVSFENVAAYERHRDAWIAQYMARLPAAEPAPSGLHDVFGDFDAADYKPDLASAIAAEIMGLKWTHVLPASDDIQDEMAAQEEHCDRYGELQEVVSAVLAKARTEPHTVLIASAPSPEVGGDLQADLQAAYDAGFEASGEGWNGEYPEGVMQEGGYKDGRSNWINGYIFDVVAARSVIRSGKLVASTGSEEETKGAQSYGDASDRDLIAAVEPVPQEWIDWCGQNDETPEAHSGAVIAVRAVRGALAGEARRAETEGLGSRASGHEVATPEATPQSSPSQTPVDPQSGWQPIETAPKDGTSFLATHEKSGVRQITWFGKASHVPLYGWAHGEEAEDIDLWSPTHWMPLPAPPPFPEAALRTLQAAGEVRHG